MIGISEIIFILFVPVFVFVIVFWFWMLIDCLKRLDDNFAVGGNNAKLIWVLVIIFTGVIGALIYYFLIKRTDSHQDRLASLAVEDGNTYQLLFSSGTRLPDDGQHIEVRGIVTYDMIYKCELNGQEVPCQPIGRVNVSNWQLQ